jgi:hypothetical protein
LFAERQARGKKIMSFKISAFVSGLWLCGFVGAATADPSASRDLLSPLDTVLLAAPAGHVGTTLVGADPRMLTVGPLSPPDIADVLGVVLPEPIAPWAPGSLPPTMAEVIGMVNLANWSPFDPLSSNWFSSGSQNNAIAEASAAWRAQNAAYQAQTKQDNMQQMTAFSEAVKAKFGIALDPDRSAFDGLVISEFNRDGGLLTTEFQWVRGDMGHVESVFAKVRTLQSGFFGE